MTKESVVMKKLIKALIILCISTGALASENEREKANALGIGKQPRVGIIAGDASGTYTQLAQDLADVSNESGAPRVMVTLGGGSIQNIVDLFEVPGIDIAIVQSDVLEATDDNAAGVQNFRDYIRYIAKLHSEEIHILAGPGVSNLKQLQGREIGFGTIGSGTSITAEVVFRALDLDVEEQYFSNAEAVARVRDGRLAAAVFVVGKPANYFNGISQDDGLHLLPVEFTNSLHRAGYLSSHFNAQDYPNLQIPASGIETIAVAAVLAVYDWEPDNVRYERVAVVTQRLFEELPRLQRGNTYHPKWKEVELGNEVPGWARSEPAEKELLRLQ